MSEVITNYTVVGSPTIDSNYILTNTNRTNYLTFNEDKVFDATKSFDIVFQYDTSSTSGYAGILQLGGLGSYDVIFYIYRYNANVIARCGSIAIPLNYNISPVGKQYYYKFSYNSTEGSGAGYYSTDGKTWTTSQKRSVTPPNITKSDNWIGRWNNYGLASAQDLLNLKSLKIIVEGSTWYEAVLEPQDPIVHVKKVFGKKGVYNNKTKAKKINCNNVPFVNNDMSFVFANCSNLTQVTNINQNTTNMAYAFAGCPTDFYEYNFPTIPNSVQDISGLFAYHTDWTDIPVNAFYNAWSKIPAHLQTNVAGFLDGCTNLSNIPSNTLPNFMTNIAYAFRNCKAMTSIPTIPDVADTLYETFAGCNKLSGTQNCVIPNSVVNMKGIFKDCYNIQTLNVSVPSSVTNIDEAFYNCSNITSGIDLNNATNITSIKNTFYNMKYIPSLENCSKLTNLYNAFYNYNKLETAPILPKNVTNLYYTFYGCSNMTTPPVIPNSVTNLYYTFYGCSNLTDAPTIPNSVTNMCSSFYHCYNLVNAPVLPNSITDITSAFLSCSKINVPPVIPNSVQRMGHALYGTNITYMPDIPSSVTHIGYCFCWCQNLVSTVNIPETVTYVDGTFQHCINLVTAPHIFANTPSVFNLFLDCFNLTGNIYIHSNSITNAENCFYNTSLQKNVYIPFTYSNGVNTATYNAFISAGYTTTGSSCGVYLKDLNQL